ncbi:MAG: sugar-binding protein [Candidatus Poribacteria bacterium]
MSKQLVFTTILILFLACMGTWAAEPGYELKIPKTPTAPKVDGVLDDAIWTATAPVKVDNINTGGKVDAPYVGDAWAAYDDNSLYVAFRNGEPNPNQITTTSPGHDQDVWKDDENELFIEPAYAGAKPYYHIMINAANVVQDDESGGAEGAWDPASLQSAVKVGDKDWVLELQIAFTDLGQTKAPAEGTKWGFNFNRHIVSGVDIWAGWSTTGPSFHTPERFGTLIFGAVVTAVAPSGKVATSWGNLKRE